MPIWSRLIREYFCYHNKGNSIDILRWIDEKKSYEVKEYIEQEIKKNILKHPCFGDKPEKWQPWGGVKARYKDLMNTITISPVLSRMFKNGELNRKEINLLVKYEYFNLEGNS